MRLLVIEPDKILAKAYVQQFLLSDIDVQVVYDGHMAVAEIDKQKPDVILLELQLAGHSGIDLLNELRSYEDWADIPVIINSAVPQESFNADESTWQRLAVVRYFYKPKTDMKQLIGAVKIYEPEQ